MENNEAVMPWERVDPPLFWKAFGGYVVADRHLPNGTRQHMVQGHAEPGLVIANAQVIGQEDCMDAVYADRLSHLSK